MARCLAVLVLAVGVLAAVPAANAAYPVPLAIQGGDGLLSKDGSVRFLAIAGVGNTSTVVTAMNVDDSSTLKTLTVDGMYGSPQVVFKGAVGGLFRDGSAFVLASTGFPEISRFLVVGTQDLAVHQRIALKGSFGFDALSPDGSRMYLIQHTTTEDFQHYVVRAYDLNAHKLLPGRIADRTQKDWVMKGFPVNRTESADGRWAYTLYVNPGGFPFIHALDSVKGVAHCIGIPWPATDRNQLPVYGFTLQVNGRSLSVGPKDGKTYRLVNTASWKVSKPAS
jgi:hypothetical protein